jgi:cytochrome c oxidase subunit I+III
MTARSPALTLHKRLARVWATPPGWRSLSAVNHNVVGKRFIVTALFFFCVGGILAMLIRAQLATSGAAFLTDATYAQVFTMHGSVMMFLFAIPLIEGFAIYLLPKMIGSRDLAYPRLGAFGYWCYVLGGAILLGALAFGLAPDAGWFMYTPLSSKAYTPGVNADVWLLGVSFVEISAIAAAVEIVVTLLTMRAPGMSLARMPLFGWYMLVTAWMMLIGFPPLIVGSLILEVERALDWPFFDVARGGDPLLWQHLFWLFGHPEVYIIFLPAAGVVSTLIPTFARRPLVGRLWIIAALIAMGFVSFGLWVHHMFAVGIPQLAQVFFSAASMLVAIPTAVQFFSWIGTLWSGTPRLRLPMLYLFGFLVVFVCGGLTGVMLALVPFNWQVHDTHFVVAHLHYVLVGGLLFPMLAGLYYWLPHMAGRNVLPHLGTWAFWLIFAGFNTTFFVMHLTGLLGMPRRVAGYAAGWGWDWPNLVSSVGSFVMAIGLALLLLDLLLAAYIGRRTPRDLWGAATLEWATPTPAPAYTFASQPWIASREPLWDDADLPVKIARGEGLLGDPTVGEQQSLGTDPLTGEPTHVLRLPAPSFLPLVAGLATLAVFVGLLAGWYGTLPFTLAAVVVVFWIWAWQLGRRDEPQPIAAGPFSDPRSLMLPGAEVAHHAPGVVGLAWTLVADGTFFASLLFGYAYLGTIAPGWPPPQWVQAGVLLPALAVLALAAPVAALRRAHRANLRDDSAGRDRWMLAAAGLGLVAAALVFASVWPGMPPPRSHAYAAIVAVCLGYALVHACIGTVMAAFCWARGRAGYLSPRRTVELRVARLWWRFTAATGILTLAAIHLPAWMAT